MRVFLRNFLILIKINLLRSFLTTYLNRIYRTLTQVSRYKLNENKLITFYIKNKHSFFGYYDINPISVKNDKVLGITINTKGNATSTAAVGYFNLSSPTNFLQVGKSKTWCWQQGNRLRWSTLDNDIIIYNKLVDDRYGCVFQNIKSKKIISSINFPIYDISTEERYGLSLNFSRLERLRPGYGYSNLPDLSSALKHPANDGVFLVDVGKNTSSLIISLDKLSRIEPCPSMEGAQHYINHLSWNLSGNRFLFFHLWAKGSTRRSRMFTSDLKGSDLFLIEKNYSKAIKLFDRSIEIKPDFWQAINNQGLAFFEKNKLKLSIQHFEKAISIQENAEPLLGLASCLRMQDIQLSVKLAKKALKKDPKYVNYSYRKDQLWGEKLQASTEALLQNVKLQKDVILAKSKISASS